MGTLLQPQRLCWMLCDANPVSKAKQRQHAPHTLLQPVACHSDAAADQGHVHIKVFLRHSPLRDTWQDPGHCTNFQRRQHTRHSMSTGLLKCPRAAEPLAQACQRVIVSSRPYVCVQQVEKSRAFASKELPCQLPLWPGQTLLGPF